MASVSVTVAPAPDEIDGPGDAWPRPCDASTWLWPRRLLAAQHPGADAARWAALREAGLRCVVDLTDAREPVADYRAVAGPGWRLLRFPIADFGVPAPATMRAVLDAIAGALAAGEPVLLHCRGGIGRSGTVAGCWRVEQGGSGDDALAWVARKWRSAARPDAPETDAQRAFVRGWAGSGAAILKR